MIKAKAFDLIWGKKLVRERGFKIAVLRSKMNFHKGNSSNFESSLLANCEGLHMWLGSRSAKGREGAAGLSTA